MYEFIDSYLPFHSLFLLFCFAEICFPYISLFVGYLFVHLSICLLSICLLVYLAIEVSYDFSTNCLTRGEIDLS